jgi:hypothetical protein
MVETNAMPKSTNQQPTVIINAGSNCVISVTLASPRPWWGRLLDWLAGMF